MNKPEHLGGGEARCHDDGGSLDYMIKHFNIESMIDVGCGRGCQVKEGLVRGLEACGVDGDIWLSGKYWGDLPITQHDYTTGPFTIDPVDLVWSVEFLEHVEEQYMPNYMKTFQSGKFIICTHATPGMKGHHHVNCQEKEYWFDKFKEFGFRYSDDLTQAIREASTMKKYFMRKNGLVFINES